VVDSRIDVEQKRQVNGLVGVEKLVLKAEALDLIEVKSRFIRENLVNSDARYRSVCSIVHTVKGQGCLSRIHHQVVRQGFKFPGQLVLNVTEEADSELSEHVDFIVLELVVNMIFVHREPELLADYVVKRNDKPKATD